MGHRSQSDNKKKQKTVTHKTMRKMIISFTQECTFSYLQINIKRKKWWMWNVMNIQQKKCIIKSP